MSLRRPLVAALLVAACSPPAAAAPKPAPRVTPVTAPAIPSTAGDQVLAPACILGINGPATWSVDYLLPPNDAYFVKLRPRRCAGCPDSFGVWVSAVHVTLDFPAPCSVPVEVSISQALGDSACAPPWPTYPRCPPVTTTLVASTTGIQSFTIPLSSPCALPLEAFAQVTFVSDGAGCANELRPRLVTTASCTLCVAYNYYPQDSTDLCEALLPGIPLLWVEGDSCLATPLVGLDPGTRRTALSLRVSPNPSRGAARLHAAWPGAEPASLSVYDVSGREVRRLFNALPDAGGRDVLWDGHDARGQAVPGGVYFAVLRSGSGAVRRTIILLR